jgi:hypothetical protein
MYIYNTFWADMEELDDIFLDEELLFWDGLLSGSSLDFLDEDLLFLSGSSLEDFLDEDLLFLAGSLAWNVTYMEHENIYI